MIVNGEDLWYAHPIHFMLRGKAIEHGVTYGLGEAGYDIRIKQEVVFTSSGDPWNRRVLVSGGQAQPGRFALASSIERFMMPDNLVGTVHDKSTWARRGLSVFNTIIEPGWNGYLTLELVYHGEDDLIIPAGAGIAQVIFKRTACAAKYTGRYQNQADKPVPAKEA